MTVLMSFRELVMVLQEIFEMNGVSRENVAILAENCAACERDGSSSHVTECRGTQTPKTGQLFIVIDPERGGNGVFRDRVSQVSAMVRVAGQERLPGDRRIEHRAKAMREGIRISSDNYEMLQSYV